LNSKKLRFVDEQCSTCTKIKEHINNRNMQSSWVMPKFQGSSS